MIRLIYNLLWPIGLLLFLPRYLVKMFRRGGYREKFGQRFGLYDVDLRRRFDKQPPIWLHAVSVGEVAIALKLAEKIHALRPGAQFALTTTTTTGFAFAMAKAVPWIEVMYTPLDFLPVVLRAFAVIRPERDYSGRSGGLAEPGGGGSSPADPDRPGERPAVPAIGKAFPGVSTFCSADVSPTRSGVRSEIRRCGPLERARG